MRKVQQLNEACEFVGLAAWQQQYTVEVEMNTLGMVPTKTRLSAAEDG